MKEQYLQMALETGFGGGSLTLFASGRILDFRINDTPVLKAENLLEEISPMLKKNAFNKGDIKRIFYATNNGSQTGLKVGESMAKGLGLGLRAEIEGRDLFEGILNKFRTVDKSALIILPYGKKDLECRFFENFKYMENPSKIKIRDFLPEDTFFKSTNELKIYTQISVIKTDFPEIYNNLNEHNYHLNDLGKNLSQYLL